MNAEQDFTARWIMLKEDATTEETNGDQATIRYQQNPSTVRKGFVIYKLSATIGQALK
jgi:hypothetical protein